MNYPDAKQLLGEPIVAQGASMMRFMDTYIEDNAAKVLRKKRNYKQNCYADFLKFPPHISDSQQVLSDKE